MPDNIEKFPPEKEAIEAEEAVEPMPRGPGRPPLNPTDKERDTVKAMAGFGIIQEDIATAMGISRPTLTKYFRRELDMGRVTAHAKIGESIFNMARSGNITAAIWYSKTQMGWRETVNHKVSGDDDGDPIRVEVSASDEIASRIAGIASRIGMAVDSDGDGGDET